MFEGSFSHVVCAKKQMFKLAIQYIHMWAAARRRRESCLDFMIQTNRRRRVNMRACRFGEKKQQLITFCEFLAKVWLSSTGSEDNGGLLKVSFVTYHLEEYPKHPTETS